MTQDPHDKEYLNLFKPKASSPDEGVPGPSEEETAATSAQSSPVVDNLGTTQPAQAVGADFTPPEQGPQKQADYPFSAPPRDNKQNMRTIGLFFGAGCLLLVLAAVVIFAFIQVFLNRDDKKVQGTPTPTDAVVLTPAPTAPVSESPTEPNVPVRKKPVVTTSPKTSRKTSGASSSNSTGTTLNGSNPQARNFLRAAQVQRKLTPISALRSCDQVLERWPNSQEAQEAKVMIKSLLDHGRLPNDIKEQRKRQGKYIGEE